MKKILLLIGLLLTSVGCSSKQEEANGSTTEISTTESSNKVTKPESRSTLTKSSTMIEQASSSIIVEDKEVTEDQKALLVVYTQQDLDDRDLEYKYQGKDTWNVVTQDTSELKKYIITNNDVKLGRIKSIYEWTGNEDDGATLIYLLVGGNELVNKL